MNQCMKVLDLTYWRAVKALASLCMHAQTRQSFHCSQTHEMEAVLVAKK